MGQTTEGFRLPVLGELDLEAELAASRTRSEPKLGLKVSTDHWVDQMVNPQFTKSQRPNTTLLVSGLTQAHDFWSRRALGHRLQGRVIDVPDNAPSATARSSATAGSATPPTSPSATW